MYEVLQHNLDRWVSPERSLVIIDSLRTLENHGANSAFDEITGYLSEDNDDTTDIIIMVMEGIINLAMDTILRAHSIEMDGEYVIKNEVLKALLALPTYDDYDTIANITMESMNPVESFCDLLELVTPHNWAHYIDSVKVVSPRLIEKINLEAVKYQTNETVDLQVVIDENKKKLLIKFKSLYPDSRAIVDIVDNQFPVGEINIDTIINIHRQYLMSLEPENTELAASEIMGLVLLSDNPISDLLKTCKQQYDILFTDINFITKVDISLMNLYAKVNTNG